LTSLFLLLYSGMRISYIRREVKTSQTCFKKMAKSTFGLEKNVASALCYVLGWVSGLFFFLAEKEDKTIRFHALQSIIFFGVLNVIVIIPFVGWTLSPFVGIVSLVGWILLLVKAYQGQVFRLPVVGNLAEKWNK